MIKYTLKDLTKLLESGHPAFYYSGCSVYCCWKDKDGFYYYPYPGAKKMKCKKKKREYF